MALQVKEDSGGYSELALWSAANLAGMKCERLRRRAPFFRELLRRVACKCRQGATRITRPCAPESLPLLASALVGSSRAMIFSVFGPPRGVTVDPGVADDQHPIWEAGVWYYPLPRNGRTAMAINFDEDFAQCVEFFEMPGKLSR